MSKNNVIFCDFPQGGPEWLRARLGVVTASQVHALMLNATKKVPTYKEARNTYMMQLVNEVCTGEVEELNARALDWGKANEEAAIAAYSFDSGNEVVRISLVYKNADKRMGASADGKLVGKNHGCEIKCPMNGVNHLNFIFNEKIKPEYITQMQFGMYVAGWDKWDFVSYNPRMKKSLIHFETIERDEEMMKYFDDELPKFLYEMDKKLEQIGMEWGAQWT